MKFAKILATNNHPKFGQAGFNSSHCERANFGKYYSWSICSKEFRNRIIRGYPVLNKPVYIDEVRFMTRYRAEDQEHEVYYYGIDPEADSDSDKMSVSEEESSSESEMDVSEEDESDVDVDFDSEVALSEEESDIDSIRSISDLDDDHSETEDEEEKVMPYNLVYNLR